MIDCRPLVHSCLDEYADLDARSEFDSFSIHCLYGITGVSINVPPIDAAVAAAATASVVSPSSVPLPVPAASPSVAAAGAAAGSPAHAATGLPRGKKFHIGYMTSYPLVKAGAHSTRTDPHPEPIKLLKLQKDVDKTRQALIEINKMGRIRFEHATVLNFGLLLNLGCEVLHFSGHVRHACANHPVCDFVCLRVPRVCMDVCIVCNTYTYIFLSRTTVSLL